MLKEIMLKAVMLKEIISKTVMNFIFRCFLCLLLGSSLFAFARELEEDGGSKVAYVSVNESIIQTGEQNKIRKTMEKERTRIEKAIKAKQNQFKKEADQIKSKIALLSDDEKSKQYERMQKLQFSIQQFVKQKDIEFRKKEADLNNQFIDRLQVVIAQVAKKSKVRLIRNRDNVLWVVNQLDITPQVVKAYKKKYR